MLWLDLKWSVYTPKPSSVAELKLFCKWKQTRILSLHCERLICGYRTAGKIVFGVYLTCLCLIFNLVRRSETVKCDKYAKVRKWVSTFSWHCMLFKPTRIIEQNELRYIQLFTIGDQRTGGMSYCMFACFWLWVAAISHVLSESLLTSVWIQLICCIVHPQESVCVSGSSSPGWRYSSSLPPSSRGSLCQCPLESSPVWNLISEALAVPNLTASVLYCDKPPAIPNWASPQD